MTMFVKISNLFFIAVCTSLLLCVTCAYAVMDSRFELDPQTLEGLKKIVKPHQTGAKRTYRKHVKQLSPTPEKAWVYTVKPGDHLAKILMHDYGMSNKEAESFIEEIKIENNIYDIKRLKAGQKINIPPVRRSTDASAGQFQSVKGDKTHDSGSGIIPEQSFKLESSIKVLSEQETITRVKDVWDRIVPLKNEQQKPLTLKASAFSLTLDPERYPSFARMDGGRIMIDQNATIPPLVKSLIENKDASVRIVSEAPSGSKHFMASLLAAAGFYSVEENFSMEFGIDPKLIVQADFKVEKTAESIIKQDVVLVNSGRTLLPASIREFLKKDGFSLYEPFASVKSFAQSDSRTIYYISSKEQHEMTDSILSALSVAVEKDRRVDVFEADNNGISLAVKAERYFESGGQRYVVTSFDGDPINYTLFRILETKGCNVIILDAQDDFRKISEKITSRMKIKGTFAKYDLLQDKSAGYSLQISGFMLDNKLLPGGGIFLTDRHMDRIVRDIFTENGFNIDNR